MLLWSISSRELTYIIFIFSLWHLKSILTFECNGFIRTEDKLSNRNIQCNRFVKFNTCVQCRVSRFNQELGYLVNSTIAYCSNTINVYRRNFSSFIIFFVYWLIYQILLIRVDTCICQFELSHAHIDTIRPEATICVLWYSILVKSRHILNRGWCKWSRLLFRFVEFKECTKKQRIYYSIFIAMQFHKFRVRTPHF